MSIFEYLTVLVLVMSAGAIFRITDVGLCRTTAVCATAFAALLSVLHLLISDRALVGSTSLFDYTISVRHMSILPLVYCLVGLVATALSSIATTKWHSYASMLLLIASAVLFIHCIQMPSLLVLLWVIECGIVWLEVGRVQATSGVRRVYVLYQLTGIGALVAGQLLLAAGWNDCGIWMLVIAILIRQAIFPFHSWFPALAESATFGVLVCYFLPQSALVFFALDVSEHLSVSLLTATATVAGVAAIYCCMLAVVQETARRALGYLLLSNTAILLFGLLAHSDHGIAGASSTWLAVSLSMAAFCMTIACLEARRGELQLATPSGNYSENPRIAISCLLFGLTSIGIPGSLVFFSEELLFKSLFEEFPLGVIVLVISASVNAITVLKMYLYLFNGRKKPAGQFDFSRRELLVVTVTLCILFIWGCFPGVLLT